MLQTSMNPSPGVGHTILVEPLRIAGRTVCSDEINIEADRPLNRLLGGYVLYISRDRTFAIDRGRGWERDCRLALVQPYAQHRLRRCDGLRSILIEPESVSPEEMDEARWSGTNTDSRIRIDRITKAFDDWEATGDVPQGSIDETFFGGPLGARDIDPRIARVFEMIAQSPNASKAGLASLARDAGLSTSRLSHLFREQLGIPIRSFRSWKRMRNSISLAIAEPVMLHAALDAGYADEAHFSRSMRKYFGQHASLMRRHWRRSMAFRDMKGNSDMPRLTASGGAGVW